MTVSGGSQLILKHASSRPFGNWSETTIVLAEGVIVGRIMRAIGAPVGSPWFWTLAYGYRHDRRPTHGYAATREAAMAAFAKSWAGNSTWEPDPFEPR
jgi:hypothetical protein